MSIDGKRGVQMIKINNLTVRFDKKTIFDSYDIELPDEGTVLITGESGIGKTTFLRIIAGLLKPEEGQIFGLSGRKVSMVFQENRLLPWMSALENVTLVSDIDTAKNLLICLGLENEMNTNVSKLSGGQQQRVSIARAFAYGNDIVLLDEPFNGLDEENRLKVVRLMHTAKLRIVVSHHAEDERILSPDKKIVL